MAIGRSEKTTLLRRVPLFDSLSDRQLAQIARLADEVAVPAGKRLATAGEAGHHLFVIVEGEAEVTRARGGKVRLGPGEFFGEMSLVDGGPRSATVEAASPMRLLVIGHREFWSLLDDAPILARRIMHTLSERVRAAEASDAS